MQWAMSDVDFCLLFSSGALLAFSAIAFQSEITPVSLVYDSITL